MQKSEYRHENKKKAMHLESLAKSRQDQRLRERLHSSMEVMSNNYEAMTNRIHKKQMEYQRKQREIGE